MDKVQPEDLQDRLTVFDVDDLTLWESNPNEADMGAIHASMEEFGDLMPILVTTDQHGRRLVIDGNHRVMVERQARRFGGRIAGIDVSGLEWSDIKALAAGLTMNSTARAGRDDPTLMAAALIAIRNEDARLLEAMSLTESDIQSLLEAAEGYRGAPEEPTEADPDDIPERPAGPTIAKPGDLWELGPHRLLVGDCRDGDQVTRLLQGVAVNLAFTSPPYADRRAYDADSGFKPIHPDEYVAWFEAVQAQVAAHLADDGSWFVNIKSSITEDGDSTELYVFDLVLAHARRWGWNLATEFCWERNGVPKNPGRRFKNQFEPIYQFAHGRWKFRPDEVRHHSDSVPIPGGKGVGNTAWHNAQGGNGSMFGGDGSAPGLAYPGNRLPTFAGTHEATGHTAAFPVGLPRFFVKAYTDPGDAVYDPFLGSGSTLLAAHLDDRVGYGMEISTKYVDIALARWQRLTGDAPKRQGKPVDFS